MNAASFVLCGCIVAKTAIPTSGAARIAEVAIRFWGCLAVSRNQKLFPHFRKARTAIFAVQEVEYSGHDRTPSFDRDHQFPRYHVSWDAIRKLDHNPSLFQADFAISGNGLFDPPTVFRRHSKLRQHCSILPVSISACRRMSMPDRTSPAARERVLKRVEQGRAGRRLIDPRRLGAVRLNPLSQDVD